MNHGAARPRCLLTPLAWAVGCLCGGAWAQALPADEPLQLRTSPMLQEKLGDAAREQAPSFVYGDRISTQPDLVTEIDGHAELRRPGLVVEADRMSYDEAQDRARARGHVRVNRAGNVFEGTELDLKVDAFEGFFLAPSYRFLINGAHGEASRVDFLDPDRAIIRDATYTTCERTGPEGKPDWILRANRIEIDNIEETGTADGAVLRFKDVPILPFPALSFPLSERRKSGFLPPTFGVDNINGLELTLPYYWDIAPNRDATFYPTVMAKRGVGLDTEFRYLEDDYRGQARLNMMPSDKLRDRERWGFTGSHDAQMQTGVGNIGLNLKLNRVSDDNYWRDFSRAGLSLTQRLLPSDGRLSWAEGDVSVNVRALKWQTLQDVSAPIVPPYDRMPQVVMRYARTNVGGLDYTLEADTTRFEADFSRIPEALRPNQPNGQRSFVLGQVSRPWVRSWGFFVPKLQLDAAQYQFDAPLATNGATSASRAVPTLSLDSGLLFERDASLFGRSLRQTLEPRAFYVRTPYRDQSLLPNYDSGANDFNFATVYSENSFVGHDRIADNNLLTLGVTTRLLDADTGAENARFGVAQRVRFTDQRVTLPGQDPVSERLSDVLVGGSVNWDPRWGFDSTVQYNPKTNRSIRTTLGGRYNPSNYRVISAAYRLQRGASEQLDIGWQWPINDLWGDRGTDLGPGRGQGGGRWYSVGRLNYSLQDRKLVDAIAGVEYDGCCWIGRVVLERLQNTTTTANTRIMFQIEFVGFSRLGSNPLRTLRMNIPRYQYLREEITQPSRFSQYD